MSHVEHTDTTYADHAARRVRYDRRHVVLSSIKRELSTLTTGIIPRRAVDVNKTLDLMATLLVDLVNDE